MEKRLLVVEDSSSMRRILDDVLTSQGYVVDVAENGSTALDMFQERTYPVVLTDLVMPVMDGNELIDKMQTHPEVPVIVVLTSHHDSDLIIEIMRKGVFDYVVKPVKKDALFLCLERAFKVSELNRLKKITDSEKIIRLEQQLEWYKYLERFGHNKSNMSEEKLFENLQRSINQGSGLGTLITLVDILASTAKKNGSVYEIDSRVIDQIQENQKLVYEAVRVFSEIGHVSANALELKAVAMMELHGMVGELMAGLAPVARLHGHTLLLSDQKNYFDTLSVKISADYFIKAVRELVVNAMKFSEPGSTIYLIIEKEYDSVIISVINSTKADDKTGIPLEYENIVFEPFFRKAKHVQDEYKTLDYGLGLTLVEKIIKKHHGTISIYNIHDHIDITRAPLTKVCCRIKLPSRVTLESARSADQGNIIPSTMTT